MISANTKSYVTRLTLGVLDVCKVHFQVRVTRPALGILGYFFSVFFGNFRTVI